MYENEWSEEFVDKMKARMMVSYHKYGPVAENYRGHDKSEGFLDAVANAKKRIEKYEETGNTEFLVDAANFCQIEFRFPQHPQAHFKATDSGACETIGFGVNETCTWS